MLRPLGTQKLARGDIEEGHTRLFAAEADACQEIVAACLQQTVAQVQTRRNQLRDAALHQLFSQLGVFELLADGHPFAGAHQPRQIRVEGMMRKPGQLHARCRSVGTPCQRYAQNPAGIDGVGGERLIEIAHPEQQNSVGVFPLHFQILLHQRRLRYLFGHTYLAEMFLESYVEDVEHPG